MKSIFACALLAGLAFALPAAAQVEGTPGAIGTTDAMSGHNTPGSGVNMRQRGYRHHHMHRHHHYRRHHRM